MATSTAAILLRMRPPNPTLKTLQSNIIAEMLHPFNNSRNPHAMVSFHFACLWPFMSAESPSGQRLRRSSKKTLG